MNIANLHQVRSEAVENQVKTLHETIQKQSSLLQRQKQQQAIINQKEQSTDETGGNIKHSKDWTNIYDKWNNWEDIEELSSSIKTTKQKLSKLKKNHEMTNRKKKNNGNDNNAFGNFCCSSSQNRIAEKKVIQMSTKKRLEHMQSFRKDHGNAEYEKGNYVKAYKWYDKSLIYYEYCFMSSGEEKKEVEEERLLCLLNIAACYLALKRYQDCVETCNEAMEVSTSYNQRKVKALFRRAQAYRYLNNFQKAKDDLDNAKEISLLSKHEVATHSMALDNELKALTETIQNYESNSKAFAKRMMGKS
jgi:tetratricopeptide (TPR) repeat protein